MKPNKIVTAFLNMSLGGLILGFKSEAGGFVVARSSDTMFSKRAIIGAPCTNPTDFLWASNTKTQNPCVVAAFVSAACQTTDEWTVAPLNSNSHYDPPSGNTSSQCTCSWAAYNLLSACTACQGSDFWTSWSVYRAACPSDEGTSYFPTNITLTSDTGIPFWAAQDPTQWTNGVFNVQQAQSLSANKTEFHGGSPTPASQTPTTQQKGKKAPIGAIVGGVLGGTVLLLAALAAWFFYRRKHRRRSSITGSPLLRPMPSEGRSSIGHLPSTEQGYHERSMSPDSSFTATSRHPSYTAMSMTTSNQHPSIASLLVSPPTAPVSSTAPVPLENFVNPFPVYEQPRTHRSTPSKGSQTQTTTTSSPSPDEGATIMSHESPPYDQASTVPGRSDDIFAESTYGEPSRPSYNPPAYSETPPSSTRLLASSPPPTPSPNPRRPAHKRGHSSTESLGSNRSSVRSEASDGSFRGSSAAQHGLPAVRE